MSSKIKAKIDCCGSNFETEKVSFTGLLTLSIPLTVICVLLIPIFFLLNFLTPFKQIKKNLITIVKANILLIEKQDLLPRVRCDVSVWTNKLSPVFSRSLYNQFNLMTLCICWAVLLTGVGFIV